jgi:type IV pilus assembly protein PilW
MSRTSQHGRTLIELLVAIALSLLILLGVGTLYLGANQSARISGNVASVEETGQILLSLLGSAIRRAGYSEIVGTDPGVRLNLLYDGPTVRGCVNQHFEDPNAGDFDCVAVAGGTGDALAIWYQADSVLAAAQGASLDCLGNAAPMWAITNPSYAGRVPGGQLPLVRNVYFARNGSLFCLGNGNPNPQPLADNVLDFKVYFGFDDDGYANAANTGERPSARSIRTANEINALAPANLISPWDFVVSVHVCVLIRTPEAGTTAGAGATFRGCPQNAAEAAGEAPAQALPADGAIRRAYTQVFTVRSRAAPTPATPI